MGELGGVLGYANLKIDLALFVGCFLGEHTLVLVVGGLLDVLSLLTSALIVRCIECDGSSNVLSSKLGGLSYWLSHMYQWLVNSC